MSEELNPAIPPGFTQQDIEKLTNIKEARKLAQQFKPSVPLSKCTKLEEVKERLRVGFLKAQGKMRDLKALEDLMALLKEKDEHNRKELIKMFSDMENILQNLDHSFKDQLQSEDLTKDYLLKIKNFQSMLKQHECPILVVGQVSSGKSSLLNLFLGKEYLPSQMLSCTASICELSYGNVKEAKLKFPNGKEKTIDFVDKDRYIFKEEKRTEKYEHDAVQLFLPAPFLKSGITLIDTPGIGENPVMENVLLDYVAKKSAFGFIFVIKCNDSGGILQRFKNLLRKLSDIKDEYGQKKLDPKSVLFVANFWDQVPDQEKEETKERIIDTLTRENSMTGFDPEQQLFFMNTKFAYATWCEKLISEDYDELIQGIERFFPVGHKRKLEVAYLWLERMIDKVLNPLRIFLASAKKPKMEITNEVQFAQKEINNLEKRLKKAHNEIAAAFVKKRNLIREEVLQFLHTKEALDEITKWTPSEIYQEDVGDAWILIEEKLDQAIDDRIAHVLENWESRHHLIDDTYTDIVDMTRVTLKEIEASLKNLEQQLWMANPDFEMASWAYSASVTEKEELPCTQEERRNSRDELDEYTNDHPSIGVNGNIEWRLMLQETPQGILDSFLSITGVLGSIFQIKKNVYSHHNHYQTDKVGYMRKRSSDVLKHLLSAGKANVDKVIHYQLEHVSKFLTIKMKSMSDSLQSDRQLLQTIKKDRRSRESLENIYLPLEKKLSELFEASITFRMKFLSLFDFPNGLLIRSESFKKRYQLQPDKAIQKSGLFGEITHIQLINKSERINVTAKRYAQYILVNNPEKDAFLKYNDIFFHVYSISTLQGVHQCVPTFMGLAQQGPALVFSGHLRIAKDVLFPSPKLSIDIKRFISRLISGLEFIHSRKLVNMDLTLDSILINEAGEPMLMNLYYPMEVPFPKDHNQRVELYVYLAPEVFPRVPKGSSSFGSRILGNRLSHRYEQSDKLYTSAADMYSLGMLLAELLFGLKIFDKFKTGSLNDFMDKNSSKEIRQCIEDAGKTTGVSSGMLKLCLDCLVTKRIERKKIKDWIEEWNAVTQFETKETHDF